MGVELSVRCCALSRFGDSVVFEGGGGRLRLRIFEAALV